MSEKELQPELPFPGYIEQIDNKLKESGKDTMVFDLDGTLFDTDMYFWNQYEKTGHLLQSKGFLIEHPNLPGEIKDSGITQYKERNNLPQEVDHIILESIRRITNKNAIPIEIENIVNQSCEDFYLISPQLLPGVLGTFFVLDKLESVKNIGVDSNAQEGWTKVKVEYLLNRFYEYYGYPFSKSIVINTVDIIKKKTQETLENAIHQTKGKPKNTIKIGDSWDYDIWPAVLAGCKQIIWVKDPKNINPVQSSYIESLIKERKIHIIVAKYSSQIMPAILKYNSLVE